MLVFFLKFIKQRSGQSICVQLLQTLNILFENISNETSVCEFLRHLETCCYKDVLFMFVSCVKDGIFQFFNLIYQNFKMIEINEIN